MGAHELIMKLRKEFDIPEEPISEEDVEKERREREARAKRMELAETEEGYVKMFNRDPWTDEWLGPGPEPPMPFLEDDLPKKAQKKAIEDRQEREHQEFIEKMGLDKDLPRKTIEEPKETKKIKKARKKLKKKRKEKLTKEMYQKTNWFLQEYAAPWYKAKIMKDLDYDVDRIVEFCVEQCEALEQLYRYEQSLKNDKRTDAEKLAAIENRKYERENGIEEIDGIKWMSVDTAYADKKEIEIDLSDGIPDIPDEHWDEFSAWERKHPMKKYKKKARKWRCSELTARRIVFIKMINKRNKKFQKDMAMVDPLTGMAFMSEKKFKKYKDKQVKRFAKQRKEFAEYVQSMVDKGYLSEEYMTTFLGDDEKAIERIKKRYKQIEERAREEAKKHKEEEEHNKKRDKELIAWFRKYGYEVEDADRPFEIVADGETLTIRPVKSGKNKIWALEQEGSTKYTENLEDFARP